MRRGDGICPSIFPRYYHIIAEKSEACKEILAQKEQEKNRDANIIDAKVIDAKVVNDKNDDKK